MHFLVSLALKCFWVNGSVNHTRVPFVLMAAKTTILCKHAAKFLGFLPHLTNALCIIVDNGSILMFVHKSYSPSKANFFLLSSPSKCLSTNLTHHLGTNISLGTQWLMDLGPIHNNELWYPNNAIPTYKPTTCGFLKLSLMDPKCYRPINLEIPFKKHVLLQHYSC